MNKLDKLYGILKSIAPVAVAFSGGADSTLLLKASSVVIPGKVSAYFVDSPFNKPGDLEHAKEIAALTGVPLNIVSIPGELSNPRLAENPVDRCYYCKKARFESLIALAGAGVTVIEGSNVDDLSDYRPGMKAVDELGVRSPLLEAGLSKPEIRELVRSFGLPNWNTPASPCLATRIPYGETITPERLKRIGEAEVWLNRAGFDIVRVRDFFPDARIEVPAADIARLSAPDVRIPLLETLRGLGYEGIFLDLDGYSRGKMNPKELKNG